MWKKISEVKFVGRPGGDMECFCWKDVPIEDMIKIKGEEKFENEFGLEEELEKESCETRGVIYDPQKVDRFMRTLYPGEAIGEIGFTPKKDKKYRFTIIVEEIEDDTNIGEYC